MRFRLITYNVHGCVGIDGRHDPGRIAAVLAAEEPDVVALQEVHVGRRRTGGVDQPAELARRLGMEALFLEAFPGHGIAVLARLPLRLVRGAPLPPWKRPVTVWPRVALWAAVGPEAAPLHLVTTHLGIFPHHRETQATALLGAEWLTSPGCVGPRVLCGDLNAPQRSLTYRRLAAALRDVHAAAARGTPRPTYPSLLPTLRLDHVLASEDVEVLAAHTGRSALARRASDHLPLVVDLATA